MPTKPIAGAPSPVFMPVATASNGKTKKAAAVTLPGKDVVRELRLAREYDGQYRAVRQELVSRIQSEPNEEQKKKLYERVWALDYLHGRVTKETTRIKPPYGNGPELASRNQQLSDELRKAFGDVGKARPEYLDPGTGKTEKYYAQYLALRNELPAGTPQLATLDQAAKALRDDLLANDPDWGNCDPDMGKGMRELRQALYDGYKAAGVDKQQAAQRIDFAPNDPLNTIDAFDALPRAKATPRLVIVDEPAPATKKAEAPQVTPTAPIKTLSLRERIRARIGG